MPVSIKSQHSLARLCQAPAGAVHRARHSHTVGAHGLRLCLHLMVLKAMGVNTYNVTRMLDDSPPAHPFSRPQERRLATVHHCWQQKDCLMSENWHQKTRPKFNSISQQSLKQHSQSTPLNPFLERKHLVYETPPANATVLPEPRAPAKRFTAPPLQNFPEREEAFLAGWP